MLRIGWFTTARGPGSRQMFEAVVSAIERGDLDATFAFVFCNREPGEDQITDDFFARVHEVGAPLVALSSARFRREHRGERSRSGVPLPAWREAYDAEVARLVDPHAADVCVLAGYMLIFTPGFVEDRAILNLHPALPDGPSGTWREVIRALIRQRATESGVMVHLAIPEVDAGPVAAYCRYPIRDAELEPLWRELDDRIDDPDDAALEETTLFQRIRERGMAREAPFLVAVLSAFAEGRLHTRGAAIVDGAGQLAEPLDVTADVEARVAEPRA